MELLRYRHSVKKHRRAGATTYETAANKQDFHQQLYFSETYRWYSVARGQDA